MQSKKYVPTEKIAEKFGISIRTVYRDVKALCEQGVPVQFEPNKGYFIVHGYFLPPVSFSSEEAASLLLMETLVNGFADKSISTHYSNALNKVKTVLRTAQKDTLDVLHQHTRFQLPPCFGNDFEYLSKLQLAIAAKTVVTIDYKNNKDEVSHRHIEPIGLIFYAFGWHLIAWCYNRQEYRDFKVVRLLKLKCVNEPFAKTDHITLNDYMKELPVPY